ncbi:gliding motility-associated C-terminal domain-containing protein [Flavobacterium soli]|uniref:gliding motility-associated C-terminal domain-containing protein n=1 Tax=Flavobacterium soli TaxID=344881 RepID=UPI000404F747|nr:T9SS C-terminal target domain-containing protein [Flavobacterium soli]
MKLHLQHIYCLVFLLISCEIIAQDVSLYQQFNGQYDFTAVGNTLNPAENNTSSNCNILNTSSETLVLSTGDVVEKAFLYWAGSGTGDLQVNLNGTTINSQRTFPLFKNNLNYFCAFADVTTLVQNTGAGNYTLSEFDLAALVGAGSGYCSNRTNFGGWAIVVVFKNNNLPMNQLNVYDGLQGVSADETDLTLTLNDLNVVDNAGAKIGFVAWEGDKSWSNNENLTFNGFDLFDEELNPINSIFNGTNSYTGSEEMFNMDLDVFSIEEFIEIGNPTATIELTSLQDFVMISTVITKLNNQLPDATIELHSANNECFSRTVLVDYTVSNFNSTDTLPAGIPIAIYANDIYIQYDETTLPIPVGESQNKTISLTIPETFPDDFTLKFIVDAFENGDGIQNELNENNNISNTLDVSLSGGLTFNLLEDITICNAGLGKTAFDFWDYIEAVKTTPTDIVSFYTSLQDALIQVNAIEDPANHIAQTNPEEIFVRIENDKCYLTTSFFLNTKNCPPKVYNYISANNDGSNDTFFVEGLRDVFVNFELQIYNRWGALVWTGNNTTEDWYGFANEGTRAAGDKLMEGTYYYILNLNDPEYPDVLTGFIHMTR